MFKKVFTASLFAGCALSLCSFAWRNPSATGQTSKAQETFWYPPSKSALTETSQLCPPTHTLTLEEMVDIGLQNNPLTKQAWRNSRSKAYFYRASQSEYYPQVDLTETFSYTKIKDKAGAIDNDGTVQTATANAIANAAAAGNNVVVIDNSGGAPSPILSNEYGNFNTDISISYLLLDFGGRAGRVHSAYHQLLAANWIHNRAIQDVMINVLVAYYRYAGNQALYQAKLDDLNDSQKNLDAAQAQFNAGVKTILDMLQAKSNLVNIELQLEALNGAVRTSLGQLVHAMGWDAHLELSIAPFPDSFPLDKISNDIALWSDLAKQNRFDLSAVQEDYFTSKQLLRVAKSDALPTLFFLGDYSYTSYPDNKFFNNVTKTAALQLNVPIFHGFYFRNKVKEARENVHLSRALLEQKKSDVLLEVLTDTVSYSTAVETFRSSEEYLKYAQEAYDAAIAQYKGGIATILDTLSALAVLSNARAQHIQAKTNWIISVANISYSAGILGLSYEDCH